MELTIFDHILVAILFIVMPVLGVTDYRKLKSQLKAGKPTARLFLYRSWIAWSWGLTLAVAAPLRRSRYRASAPLHWLPTRPLPELNRTARCMLR